MAAANTLVLKDKAAVNVNYYPIRVETGKEARYEDRTNTELAMQPHATLFYSQDSKVRKVTGVVDYPVKDAITGVITRGIGTFECRFPTVHTLDERKEVLARVRAMIDDAVVTAAAENGETPW